MITYRSLSRERRYCSVEITYERLLGSRQGSIYCPVWWLLMCLLYNYCYTVYLCLMYFYVFLLHFTIKMLEKYILNLTMSYQIIPSTFVQATFGPLLYYYNYYDSLLTSVLLLTLSPLQSSLNTVK